MTKTDQTLPPAAMVVLIILCASWGLQQVAIKVACQGISPILQAGIRSFVASILIWVWMTSRRKSIFKNDGTLWWGLAAGFLFSAEFFLVYKGLDFTNASRAVIFLYMSPFVVAVGSKLFIPDEQLNIIQIIGLCSAFIGIIAAFHESMGLPTFGMLIGDSMLMAAAVFWGATTVLIKASPLAKISPAKTLLYQLAFSAVVLPVGSWFIGEPGIVKLSPLVIASLVYQAVWVAFITYFIWFWLIRQYFVSRIASFTFLTPIFGVFAGHVLLEEPISNALLLALMLVGSGIYLVNRPIK